MTILQALKTMTTNKIGDCIFTDDGILYIVFPDCAGDALTLRINEDDTVEIVEEEDVNTMTRH